MSMGKDPQYSMDWNNSTPCVYQFLNFFPTVRSLFQTICLFNLGPEAQHAHFREEKALLYGSKIAFDPNIMLSYSKTFLQV